jgi:F-type H+-transporting ATPase subunit b
MNALILLAANASDGQISQIAKTFGVDWPHFGAQTISFALVCGVLYKVAYKKVLAMLEERRKLIAEGLGNAERIKAELDRTEANRQEVMAEAYAKSAKVIEEARAAGARILEQETQRASAVAEQIISKAREDAAQDHERMLAELKHEVGRLVVQATAVVTGKVLTSEDRRRLAEEAARQIAA